MSVLIAAVLFLTSACKASIARNEDGSFDVETTISQQELQDVITASIADPLIREVTVTLQTGYALVTGVRERLNDTSRTDTLSFRLDLGVRDGQLTASISDAVFDGFSIEQNRIEHWNQTIANRIEILGRRNPNSTLISVSISPDAVALKWNVRK
jgi:hypothetical protein